MPRLHFIHLRAEQILCWIFPTLLSTLGSGKCQEYVLLKIEILTLLVQFVFGFLILSGH